MGAAGSSISSDGLLQMKDSDILSNMESYRDADENGFPAKYFERRVKAGAAYRKHAVASGLSATAQDSQESALAVLAALSQRATAENNADVRKFMSVLSKIHTDLQLQLKAGKKAAEAAEKAEAAAAAADDATVTGGNGNSIVPALPRANSGGKSKKGPTAVELSIRTGVSVAVLMLQSLSGSDPNLLSQVLFVLGDLAGQLTQIKDSLSPTLAAALSTLSQALSAWSASLIASDPLPEVASDLLKLTLQLAAAQGSSASLISVASTLLDLAAKGREGFDPSGAFAAAVAEVTSAIATAAPERLLQSFGAGMALGPSSLPDGVVVKLSKDGVRCHMAIDDSYAYVFASKIGVFKLGRGTNKTTAGRTYASNMTKAISDFNAAGVAVLDGTVLLIPSKRDDDVIELSAATLKAVVVDEQLFQSNGRLPGGSDNRLAAWDGRYVYLIAKATAPTTATTPPAVGGDDGAGVGGGEEGVSESAVLVVDVPAEPAATASVASGSESDDDDDEDGEGEKKANPADALFVYTLDPRDSFALVRAAPLLGAPKEGSIEADDVVVAVNCGGPAYTSSDGIEYSADHGFSHSRTYYLEETISRTSDSPLYQSNRYSESKLVYNFPNVPPGRYVLALHVAELRSSSNDEHVMNVMVNNTPTLGNFDTHAVAGYRAAKVLMLPVSVASQGVKVSFESTRGRGAQVCGLVIARAAEDECDTFAVRETQLSSCAAFANSECVSIIMKAKDGPSYIRGRVDDDSLEARVVVSASHTSGHTSLLSYFSSVGMHAVAAAYDAASNTVLSFDADSAGLEVYRNYGLSAPFDSVTGTVGRPGLLADYDSVELSGGNPGAAALALLSSLDSVSSAFAPPFRDLTAVINKADTTIDPDDDGPLAAPFAFEVSKTAFAELTELLETYGPYILGEGESPLPSGKDSTAVFLAVLRQLKTSLAALKASSLAPGAVGLGCPSADADDETAARSLRSRLRTLLSSIVNYSGDASGDADRAAALPYVRAAVCSALSQNFDVFYKPDDQRDLIISLLKEREAAPADFLPAKELMLEALVSKFTAMSETALLVPADDTDAGTALLSLLCDATLRETREHASAAVTADSDLYAPPVDLFHSDTQSLLRAIGRYLLSSVGEKIVAGGAAAAKAAKAGTSSGSGSGSGSGNAAAAVVDEAAALFDSSSSYSSEEESESDVTVTAGGGGGGGGSGAGGASSGGGKSSSVVEIVTDSVLPTKTEDEVASLRALLLVYIEKVSALALECLTIVESAQAAATADVSTPAASGLDVSGKTPAPLTPLTVALLASYGLGALFHPLVVALSFFCADDGLATPLLVQLIPVLERVAAVARKLPVMPFTSDVDTETFDVPVGETFEYTVTQEGWAKSLAIELTIKDDDADDVSESGDGGAGVTDDAGDEKEGESADADTPAAPAAAAESDGDDGDDVTGEGDDATGGEGGESEAKNGTLSVFTSADEDAEPAVDCEDEDKKLADLDVEKLSGDDGEELAVSGNTVTLRFTNNKVQKLQAKVSVHMLHSEDEYAAVYWIVDFLAYVAGRAAATLIAGGNYTKAEVDGAAWLNSNLFSGGMEEIYETLPEYDALASQLVADAAPTPSGPKPGNLGPVPAQLQRSNTLVNETVLFAQDLITNDEHPLVVALSKAKRPAVQSTQHASVGRALRSTFAAILKHESLSTTALAFVTTNSDGKPPQSLVDAWVNAQRVVVWMAEQRQADNTPWDDLAAKVSEKCEFLLRFAPSAALPDEIIDRRSLAAQIREGAARARSSSVSGKKKEGTTPKGEDAAAAAGVGSGEPNDADAKEGAVVRVQAMLALRKFLHAEDTATSLSKTVVEFIEDPLTTAAMSELITLRQKRAFARMNGFQAMNVLMKALGGPEYINTLYDAACDPTLQILHWISEATRATIPCGSSAKPSLWTYTAGLEGVGVALNHRVKAEFFGMLRKTVLPFIVGDDIPNDHIISAIDCATVSYPATDHSDVDGLGLVPALAKFVEFDVDAASEAPSVDDHLHTDVDAAESADLSRFEMDNLDADEMEEKERAFLLDLASWSAFRALAFDSLKDDPKPTTSAGDDAATAEAEADAADEEDTMALQAAFLGGVVEEIKHEVVTGTQVDTTGPSAGPVNATAYLAEAQLSGLVDSAVVVATPPPLPATNAFTLTLWVNVMACDGAGLLVSQYDAAAAHAIAELNVSPGSDDDTFTLAFEMSGDDNTTTSVELEEGLPTQTWHAVTLRLSSGMLTISVNGGDVSAETTVDEDFKAPVNSPAGLPLFVGDAVDHTAVGVVARLALYYGDGSVDGLGTDNPPGDVPEALSALTKPATVSVRNDHTVSRVSFLYEVLEKKAGVRMLAGGEVLGLLFGLAGLKDDSEESGVFTLGAAWPVALRSYWALRRALPPAPLDDAAEQLGVSSPSDVVDRLLAAAGVATFVGCPGSGSRAPAVLQRRGGEACGLARALLTNENWAATVKARIEAGLSSIPAVIADLASGNARPDGLALAAGALSVLGGFSDVPREGVVVKFTHDGGPKSALCLCVDGTTATVDYCDPDNEDVYVEKGVDDLTAEQFGAALRELASAFVLTPDTAVMFSPLLTATASGKSTAALQLENIRAAGIKALRVLLASPTSAKAVSTADMTATLSILASTALELPEIVGTDVLEADRRSAERSLVFTAVDADPTCASVAAQNKATTTPTPTADDGDEGTEAAGGGGDNASEKEGESVSVGGFVVSASALKVLSKAVASKPAATTADDGDDGVDADAGGGEGEGEESGEGEDGDEDVDAEVEETETAVDDAGDRRSPLSGSEESVDEADEEGSSASESEEDVNAEDFEAQFGGDDVESDYDDEEVDLFGGDADDYSGSESESVASIAPASGSDGDGGDLGDAHHFATRPWPLVLRVSAKDTMSEAPTSVVRGPAAWPQAAQCMFALKRRRPTKEHRYQIQKTDIFSTCAACVEACHPVACVTYAGSKDAFVCACGSGDKFDSGRVPPPCSALTPDYYEVEVGSLPEGTRVAVGVATAVSAESTDYTAASAFFSIDSKGGAIAYAGGMAAKPRPTAAFGAGDVVGVGVDYVAEVVFFTINGERVNVNFDAPVGHVVPTVWTFGEGAAVTGMFERADFRFDLSTITGRKSAGESEAVVVKDKGKAPAETEGSEEEGVWAADTESLTFIDDDSKLTGYGTLDGNPTPVVIEISKRLGRAVKGKLNYPESGIAVEFDGLVGATGLMLRGGKRLRGPKEFKVPLFIVLSLVGQSEGGGDGAAEAGAYTFDGVVYDDADGPAAAKPKLIGTLNVTPAKSPRGFSLVLRDGGYVNLGSPDELKFDGAYALEAWMKLDAVDSGEPRYILSRGHSATGTSVFVRVVGDSVEAGTLIHPDGGDEQRLVAVGKVPKVEKDSAGPAKKGGSAAGGDESVVPAAEGGKLANTWTHVSAVFSNGAWTLYINGEEVGESGEPGDAFTDADEPVGPWIVGAEVEKGKGGAVTGCMFGVVDEIRMFSGLRDAETVKTEMGGHNAKNSAGSWTMSVGGVGTNVFDGSLNANKGSLVGAACWEASRRPVANTKRTMLWDSDKVSTFMTVSPDGVEVEYTASQYSGWGTALADLEFSNEVVEWEIEVLKVQDTNMMIGVTEADQNLQNYAGSSQHGWSWQPANQGYVYHNCDSHYGYGTRALKAGDVVKVCLDQVSDELHFWLDDEDMGKANTWTTVTTSEKTLRACVSMYSAGDKVAIRSVSGGGGGGSAPAPVVDTEELSEEEKNVRTLAGLGFAPEAARAALEGAKGDLAVAATELFAAGALADGEEATAAAVAASSAAPPLALPSGGSNQALHMEGDDEDKPADTTTNNGEAPLPLSIGGSGWNRMIAGRTKNAYTSLATLYAREALQLVLEASVAADEPPPAIESLGGSGVVSRLLKIAVASAPLSEVKSINVKSEGTDGDVSSRPLLRSLKVVLSQATKAGEGETATGAGWTHLLGTAAVENLVATGLSTKKANDKSDDNRPKNESDAAKEPSPELACLASELLFDGTAIGEREMRTLIECLFMAMGSPALASDLWTRVFRLIAKAVSVSSVVPPRLSELKDSLYESLLKMMGKKDLPPTHIQVLFELFIAGRESGALSAPSKKGKEAADGEDDDGAGVGGTASGESGKKKGKKDKDKDKDKDKKKDDKDDKDGKKKKATLEDVDEWVESFFELAGVMASLVDGAELPRSFIGEVLLKATADRFAVGVETEHPAKRKPMVKEVKVPHAKSVALSFDKETDLGEEFMLVSKDAAGEEILCLLTNDAVKNGCVIKESEFYVTFPADVGLIWDPERSNDDFTFSEDMAIATYTSGGGSWRTCMAMMPLSAGKHVWTIELTEVPSCSIMVGLQTGDCNTDMYCGYSNGEGSYSFNCSGYQYMNGSGEGYGSSCYATTGDKVSVEVDFDADTLAYYYNGEHLGVAKTGGFAGKTWYPAVSLCSADNKVKIYYGLEENSRGPSTSRDAMKWGLALQAIPKDYMHSAVVEVVEELSDEVAEFSKQSTGFSLEFDRELVAYVSEQCESTGVEAKDLDASVFEADESKLGGYPLLLEALKQGGGIKDLRGRLAFLQHFNEKVESTSLVSLIDLTSIQQKGTLAYRLGALRGLIFSSAKDVYWKPALKKTESQERPNWTIDRVKAADVIGETPSDKTLADSSFGQAYAALKDRPAKSLRNPERAWSVDFRGENSIDAGGPFRESLCGIIEELQMGHINLLVRTPNGVSKTGSNQDRWVPNPDLRTTEHLSMFEFLGKIIGIALREHQSIELDLAPMVWKQLLGEEIDRSDLESYDKMIVQCCDQIADVEALGVTAETFSDTFFEVFTTQSAGGKELELKPNGRKIPVTFDNRTEYVTLVEKARLDETKPACEAMRRGIAAIVPVHFMDLFSWQELELRVCGRRTFDLALLKKKTRYSGHNSSDDVVKWFWEVMEEYDTEDRQNFLRFVWGRSRLPMREDEFGMPFTFATSYSGGDAFPEAHTCSFQIDMPSYGSIEMLRDRLTFAIRNCRAIDGD